MKERSQKYNDQSKDRLLSILEKKFKTTYIGALAAFEDEFGYLWGHGKHFNELSEDERHCREIWEDVRNRILDNGNNNFRAAKQEFDYYTVSWDRYVTNFKVTNRG